jgi:hypothetical protein
MLPFMANPSVTFLNALSLCVRRHRSTVSFSVLLCALLGAGVAAAQAPAPPPKDILVFTNGDQLSGTLTSSAGGNIVFNSDMAGSITVPLDKVKELRTQGSYIVLKTGEGPKEALKSTPGKVEVSDSNLTVAPATGAPIVVPVKDVAYLVDQGTYNKVLNHKPKLTEGWNGAATLGATAVQSSQHGTTFSGGVALVRQVPLLSFFPTRYKTLVNFQETYGTLTQDAQPAVGIIASTVKTSIMHANLEHDVYFSPKFFVLATATWDHNYAQLLQLQQIYGVGIGYTVFNTPKHELDLRVDAHYEKQQFVDPTSNVNLFGSTFGETYRRTLPLKLQFNEALSLTPAWNDPSVFSANAMAGLTLPVWHRLGVNMNATDSYLTNPPAGALKNSFQYVLGLTYTLQ